MSRPLDRCAAPRVRFDARTGLWLPERKIVDPKAVGFGAAPASASAAKPPIAYVTSNLVTGATGAPSGGAGGQIIIGIAVHAGPGAAIPSLPASGWEDPGISRDAGDAALIVGWRIHSGSEGSYTWSGATRVCYLIYSGVDTTTPIGEADTSATTGSSWTCPAKTMAAVTSWMVWAASSANGGGTPGTPSGLTSRQDFSNSGGMKARFGDSGGAISSYAGGTGSLTGSTHTAGVSLELLAA